MTTTARRLFIYCYTVLFFVSGATGRRSILKKKTF
jgi:hypothetical protein